MRNYLPALIFCLLLFFPLSYSHAQPSAEKGPMLELGIDHAFDSRISSSDTEVSRTRYRIRGSYSFLTLGYDHVRYSWDDHRDAGLAAEGRTPWEVLHHVYISADRMFPLMEQWMLSLGGGAASSFEKEVSDSFGVAARVILIRKFEKGWAAGVGVVGAYHPVRTLVVPAASISYGIHKGPGWSVRAGFPRTKVRYGISDQLALQAAADYRARIYRLKNDSPVAEKGYFRKREVKLGLQLEAKPVRNMILTAGPYYLVARKWRLYDQDESRITSENLKSSPGVEASLSWRF